MNHTRREQVVPRWFRHGTIALAAVLGVVWFSSWAPAQSPRDVVLLKPREVRRLPEQAREEYEKAVQALDHVNPILAIKHFDKASELAPDAIDLHFLTARLAHLRARMVFGADESRSRDLAEDYYDIAEKALQRVGQIKDLTPLTKRRYEAQLQMINEEQKKLKIRDQQRKAVGDVFRKLYAKERYPDEAEEEGEGGEGKAVAKKRTQPRQPARRPPPRPPRPRRTGGSDMES